jgi:hypothetical protein
LGRPVRIHDQECDVEELCEADFDLDMAPASKIMISQERYHAQYPIAMSKLAKICELRSSAPDNASFITMTDYWGQLAESS